MRWHSMFFSYWKKKTNSSTVALSAWIGTRTEKTTFPLFYRDPRGEKTNSAHFIFSVLQSEIQFRRVKHPLTATFFLSFSFLRFRHLFQLFFLFLFLFFDLYNNSIIFPSISVLFSPLLPSVAWPTFFRKKKRNRSRSTLCVFHVNGIGGTKGRREKVETWQLIRTLPFPGIVTFLFIKQFFPFMSCGQREGRRFATYSRQDKNRIFRLTSGEVGGS